MKGRGPSAAVAIWDGSAERDFADKQTTHKDILDELGTLREGLTSQYHLY